MPAFEPGRDDVRPPPVQVGVTARAAGPTPQPQQDAAVGELDIGHVADGARPADGARAKSVGLSCAAAEHGFEPRDPEPHWQPCAPVCREVQAPLRDTGGRHCSRPSSGPTIVLVPKKEGAMCRWMAWLGQPVLIEELLFKTQHGIVDQALHARMGAEPTNGDGFGVGWYGTGEGPAVFRSVSPAWSDANLRDLAAHVESPLFLVHVRAAIGSPVQQTNCHPFRRGSWLFVHNGFLAGFHELRRDLMLDVDPDLFGDMEGSTDSEVVFYLAITLGLEADPIGALQQVVG